MPRQCERDKMLLHQILNVPGLSALFSSSLHSFFLTIYHIVDRATLKVVTISLIDLFCFVSLMMASFTCIYIPLNFILIAQVKQLPDINSTSEINCGPFMLFICLEVREHTPHLTIKLLVRQLSTYF